MKDRNTRASHVDVLVLKENAKLAGMPAAESGPVALIESVHVPSAVHPFVAVWRHALLSGTVGDKTEIVAHEAVTGRMNEMRFTAIRDAFPRDGLRMADQWPHTGWFHFTGDDFGAALNNASDRSVIVCAFPKISDEIVADAANILAAVYGVGGVYDLRSTAHPVSKKAKRTVRKPTKALVSNANR